METNKHEAGLEKLVGLFDLTQSELQSQGAPP